MREFFLYGCVYGIVDAERINASTTTEITRFSK